MDNHKLVVTINWIFFNFPNYEKKYIFFFIKYAWNFLELGCMNNNKDKFLYFFSNKEFFYFLYFSEILKKKASIFNVGSVCYSVILKPKY